MIEGQVVAVISERQLVFNRGEAHGVAKGMEFAVMAPAPIELTDPATNEALGTIQQEKIRVRVVRVEPAYSVAQTFQETGGRKGVLDYMDVFKSEEPVTRTLRQDDALFQPLSEQESSVKRGDPIRQVERL